MGRPQTHTASPIFKLREQLGGDRPLPQREMATLLGVSPDSLKSIEMGRIKSLTPALLLRIEQRTHSEWDAAEQVWFFLHSRPRQPTNMSLLQQYTGFLTDAAPIPETDPEIIKMRVDGLFQVVPRDRWMKLFWHLRDCLEECRETFVPDDAGVRRLFKTTTDYVLFQGRDKVCNMCRSYDWHPDMRAYDKAAAKYYRARAKRLRRSPNQSAVVQIQSPGGASDEAPELKKRKKRSPVKPKPR